MPLRHRTSPVLIALACVLACMAPAAHAAPASVKVTFVHPERFDDEDFRHRFTPSERAAAVRELTGYIVRTAQSLLKGGQSLRVEILDVQRAAIYNPLRANAANVRILKDTTPPRITLRYQLTGTGPAQSGRETLTDLNYLMNPSGRFSGDPFVYEKALLADWLRKIAAR